MHNTILKSSITFLIILTAQGVSADEPLAGYIPSSVEKVCEVSDDTFNKSWVNISLPVGKSGYPIGPFFDKESGIAYIFPANGPAFSTAWEKDTNCAFYKWSSQMFLWLTSSVSDTGTPPSGSAFSHTGINTPYVFSSEFFYRLTNGVLTPQSHTNPLSMKHLRSTKQDEGEDSIGQAGGEGVLFTQANTDISKSSSLVYYEVLTNRSYGYVADAVINDAKSPYNYTEFVDDSAGSCSAIKYGFDQGFVDNTGQTAALLYNLFCPKHPIKITGIPTVPTSIPQLETAIDFLSMNMEIKTAWVEVSSLEHPERYITQKGSIPIYTKVEGKNEMIHSWTANADLALVGMHVVGSVKGHPEMVWATFEHVDNAPNATYYYTNKKGKVKSQTDTSTNANKKWLISEGTSVSTVTEYGVSYEDPTSSVQYIKPSSTSQTAPVNTPSNVNRINPWGSIQGKASAKSNSAVISTNISALSQLQNFYAAKGVNQRKKTRVLTIC